MLVITRSEGEHVVIGDPTKPIGVVRVASIDARGGPRPKGAPLAVVRDPSLVDDDLYDELLKVLTSIAISEGAGGLADRNVAPSRARVRLAFDFPREVVVHRGEIAEQIQADQPRIAGSIRPKAGA